jgi:predicted acetyltransferase
MMGIAAVGIAPQYRGTGAAIALMQHTLNEIHAKGIAISALYPATQRLYRKAGYEQAGNRCSWEIPTASIQIREQPLPLQPVVPINLEVFYGLYQKQAKLINGNLGLFTPYQLQLTGRLEATETALNTAAQVFAGVSPWMPDFF